MKDWKRRFLISSKLFISSSIKKAIANSGKNIQPRLALAQLYETALTGDPNLAVAANNLAWILCEKGGTIDQALSLPQTRFEISIRSKQFQVTRSSR